jgi:hypothetical protein
VKWHNILWCVIHTILGWLYIVYFLAVYIFHVFHPLR